MPKRSNLTGLYYARESALKTLPVTPIWYGLEPNSYSETGGELSTVARSPIDPSRQNKKGTITDLNANAGFNIDKTKSNLLELMQGFLYADAREPAKTKPLNGTSVSISAVTTTEFQASSGLLPFDIEGGLVYGYGFENPGNNGLHVISGAEADAVTSTGLTAEAAPPTGAGLTLVGKQFTSGDFSATLNGGILTFSSANDDIPVAQITPGSWVYIGGDDENTFFETLKRGFFRVRSVSEGSIVVDDCILDGGGSLVSDTGTGKTIQLFFGTVIKNELNPSLIKRFSYQIERQLGVGVNPPNVQAEYIMGCVPNELKINIPGQDKITADLSFVSCDVQYVTGASGNQIKSGTRVAAIGEDAFNTTSDAKRIKLARNAAGSYSEPLFAFASDVNFTINNNAKPSKAIGVLGALDVNYGNVEFTGSVTAYFETVDAFASIRGNDDCSFVSITVASGKNHGFLFDVPLLSIGDGQPDIEKDEDIMVPLELQGAQSKFGHTVLYSYFEYLPSSAGAV